MSDDAIRPDLTTRLLDLADMATDLVVRMHTIQKMNHRPFVPRGKILEDMLVNELCAACIEANALMMQAETVASNLAGKTVKELASGVWGVKETGDG